jgi:hypothetical protein
MNVVYIENSGIHYNSNHDLHTCKNHNGNISKDNVYMIFFDKQNKFLNDQHKYCCCIYYKLRCDFGTLKQHPRCKRQDDPNNTQMYNKMNTWRSNGDRDSFYILYIWRYNVNKQKLNIFGIFRIFL